MPQERHPTDAELLGLTQDPATGVDYIATGRSPYYLEYRRSLHRTLRAAERANDLRVYLEDDLHVGVRPGRCFIGEAPVTFAGQSSLAIPVNTTTYLWLEADGLVYSSNTSLPADRSSFIPLAQVAAGPSEIDTLVDLRGEAFLQAPSAAILGLTASAAEINQALDGIAATVTPSALNQLTQSPFGTGDNYHTHQSLNQDNAGEAIFYLSNQRFSPTADLSIRFSVPERYAFDTVLAVNPNHHFFEQRYGGVTHTFVSTIHVDHTHNGDLTASLVDVSMGVVPITGKVVGVVLGVADNLQSSDSADGISAQVHVNGVSLTTSPATLTSVDGAGFSSTDQGDGSAATLKTDGTESVSRGDVLTLDLTRTANGTVTTEARHACVLVVIRAAQPE